MSNRLVDRGVHHGHVAYGINTGFGLFSDVVIPPDQLEVQITLPTRIYYAEIIA